MIFGFGRKIFPIGPGGIRPILDDTVGKVIRPIWGGFRPLPKERGELAKLEKERDELRKKQQQLKERADRLEQELSEIKKRLMQKTLKPISIKLPNKGFSRTLPVIRRPGEPSFREAEQRRIQKRIQAALAKHPEKRIELQKMQGVKERASLDAKVAFEGESEGKGSLIWIALAAALSLMIILKRRGKR